MKNLKSTNKGITLIALVITIIVMLILVAVTISMAVNGGLFNYAKKATGEMQNAIDEEQLLAEGKIKIGETWYNSIDEYLGTEKVEEIHNWTRTGDIFTCSHCEAEYTMGEVVDYEDAGAASTTLTASKSGVDKYYEDMDSTYPDFAKVDANGNQTIEAQDVNWVVLGIEDTNKDGKNETLLITTETDLWGVDEEENWYGVCFYGAAGYNNAVDEINRICKELYSNSEYGEARGMTIEDVNSALNYTPTGGMYEDEEGFHYTVGLKTPLSEIEGIYNSIIEQENYKTPDGTNTPEALGEYEINGYWYFVKNGNSLELANEVNSDTETITEIERNTIFGPYNEEWECCEYSYWLASRGVYATSDYAYFGPGGVGEGNASSSYGLFTSYGGENDNRGGLRPVVSLKSKLPAVK